MSITQVVIMEFSLVLYIFEYLVLPFHIFMCMCLESIRLGNVLLHPIVGILLTRFAFSQQYLAVSYMFAHLD